MTVHQLDCRALACPMPIVRITQAMKTLAVGERLVVEARDPAFRSDLAAWIEQTGHALVELEDGDICRVTLEKRHDG